jgi:hypothetical protein
MVRNRFSEVNKYFLIKRLERVPHDVLESYFQDHFDITTKISRKKLIDEIWNNLQLLGEDHEFIQAFSSFFRDHVLSAKESQYILQITNSEDVLKWIKSWEGGKFPGQRYDFTLHVCLDLEPRFLGNGGNSISFPTCAVFLIAKSHRIELVPSGQEILEIHPTREFELIFRQNQHSLEVRGDFKIIRDFINSSVEEFNSPLKSAASLAVGDVNDELKKRAVVTPARYIKIDKLKAALKGAYTSASSKTAGSHIPRVTLEFEGMHDSSDETDPVLRAVAERVLKDPDKGKISFTYDKKNYSFGITKSGGLTFMKYTPEEVVTYILHKIQGL